MSPVVTGRFIATADYRLQSISESPEIRDLNNLLSTERLSFQHRLVELVDGVQCLQFNAGVILIRGGYETTRRCSCDVQMICTAFYPNLSIHLCAITVLL